MNWNTTREIEQGFTVVSKNPRRYLKQMTTSVLTFEKYLHPLFQRVYVVLRLDIVYKLRRTGPYEWVL